MINKPNSVQDKVNLRESLFLADGTPIAGPPKTPTKLIGEVTVINGLTGKKMFTFNDIIIPGATYILEKFFNRRSTFGMPTLSQDLDIKANVPPNQDNLKNELTFGFVVGIGGVTPPELVKSVKFKDKTVETIVPLRVVDVNNDLSPTERQKYAMRKVVGDKVHYYAKKFESDVVIRHLFTDGTEIPPNIDQSDTSLGLLVFGECVFTVSQNDLREYFMETYGSINNCRFNSIGLVAGFLDGDDYAGVRTVTKFNTTNLFLKDTESFYDFIYKVYAV